jgi:hypothetical protein
VAVAVVLTRLLKAEMGVLEVVAQVTVQILLKQQVQLTLVAVEVELAQEMNLARLEVLE